MKVYITAWPDPWLMTPRHSPTKAYLPGAGDTMIMKVVPPGRGLALHSASADPCDYPKCG